MMGKTINVKRIDDLVYDMLDKYYLSEEYQECPEGHAVIPFEEVSEEISDDIIAEISKIMAENYAMEYYWRIGYYPIHPDCKYTFWVEKVGDNTPHWGITPCIKE